MSDISWIWCDVRTTLLKGYQIDWSVMPVYINLWYLWLIMHERSEVFVLFLHPLYILDATLMTLAFHESVITTQGVWYRQIIHSVFIHKFSESGGIIVQRAFFYTHLFITYCYPRYWSVYHALSVVFVSYFLTSTYSCVLWPRY